MPALVGYVLLFIVVGVGFILVHLVMGKIVRPARPDSEKMTIYECGEPTIGSAWVQFDLRYYVVALLFVIFDVEVAFFFPWAVVYGKLNDLSNPNLPVKQRIALTVGDSSTDLDKATTPLIPAYDDTREQRERFQKTLKEGTEEKASEEAKAAAQKAIATNAQAANHLGWIAFFDILVFFGVLVVGFIYLWRRGDLDWVRSTAAEEAAEAEEKAEAPAEKADVLVGAGGS